MKYSSLVIFTVFFLAFSSFLSIQNIQAASFASGNQIYSNQIQFSFGQGAYGDIDNDGDLDIVGQTLGYFPSILYNVNGTISNSEQDHLPPERGFYYGSTLGDLDGDGDLEYITAGPNGADDSPNIVYYYDNVNERYERVGTTYEIANLAFYGYAVEVGDFVEDGKPDVLWFGPDDAILGVNSTTTADNITFSSISSVGSINRTEWGNDTTATGDFNGDGHLDFILVDDESGAGGTYQIGYGDGAGNFSIFSDGGVGDTRTAYKMDVGDFNSDGRDDFVLLRADLANDDSEVRLYVRNSANDGFDVSTIVSSTSDDFSNVVVGNINSDEYLDLAILLGPYIQVDVYTNQGDNTFASTPDDSLSVVARHFWIDDIDNNGQNDILTAFNNNLFYYAQNTPQYTLTYSSGSGGALSGSTSQTVDENSIGTAVTAVPDTGYEFVSWSDDSTQNPRTDTNVTQNLSVSAIFQIKSFSLTYTAGAGGTISGNTSQTISYGQNGTAVMALPSSGYQFLNWSDGSTQNPRTDSFVTANKSITANFLRVEEATSNNLSNSSMSFVPVITANSGTDAERGDETESIEFDLEVVNSEEVVDSSGSLESEEESNNTILSYWWIPLIIVLIIGGFIYTYNKKS